MMTQSEIGSNEYDRQLDCQPGDEALFYTGPLDMDVLSGPDQRKLLKFFRDLGSIEESLVEVERMGDSVANAYPGSHSESREEKDPVTAVRRRVEVLSERLASITESFGGHVPLSERSSSTAE